MKIIGASLSGVFPSWFSGREKPFSEDGDELPDMPFEPSAARIIVIGDTEFATSLPFSVGGNGQANMDFLLNAAGWLCNDDDIIKIRSRESGSGHLDRITDREKKAAAMWLARLVNIIIVPLLVVAAGIIFVLWRRQKAKSYQEIPLAVNEKEQKDGI
jgi:ABC-type uncharacterized transport system involved in gliding motility auxiliary subunit